MTRRFTEGQVIGFLQEQDAGAEVADPALQYGISNAAAYGH